MGGLFWLIAERLVTKILDKALENEKKPVDTKPSDTFLNSVRYWIQHKASDSGDERGDSRVSDRPEQPKQDS